MFSSVCQQLFYFVFFEVSSSQEALILYRNHFFLSRTFLFYRSSLLSLVCDSLFMIAKRKRIVNTFFTYFYKFFRQVYFQAVFCRFPGQYKQLRNSGTHEFNYVNRESNYVKRSFAILSFYIIVIYFPTVSCKLIASGDQIIPSLRTL